MFITNINLITYHKQIVLYKNIYLNACAIDLVRKVIIFLLKFTESLKLCFQYYGI